MEKHAANLKKALWGVALVPALAVCAAAAPAAAQTQPLPSYATAGDATIQGVVRSIDGRYNITVRDVNGYIDRVALHDGTIINPTGLTLAPGQTVTILGRPNGSTFDANEIDTPYVAYGYGYPAYPYPYAPYGFYPHVALGFGFYGGGFAFHGRY